ncbi:MAG: hypothetical protein RIC14_08970 [Filomicrobium sp.]
MIQQLLRSVQLGLIVLAAGFVLAEPVHAGSKSDDSYSKKEKGDKDAESAKPAKPYVPVHVWEQYATLPGGPKPPYMIVRKIIELQNRVARGDRSAFKAQKAQLAAASRELLAVDRTLWLTDLRNARAALKFVMSGGPPDILRQLIRDSLLPTRYLKLATAVLAYSEGRKLDAYRLLRDANPRDMEATLAGHMALIKALTIGARRPNEIRKLLNDARILSPGTIVEESALRRQIPLEATMPGNGQFDMLTSRYLRRFGQSVFSSGLLLQVAETLAREDYAGGDPKKLRRLKGFLEKLRPSQRKRLLMSLAREATGWGLAKTTKFAVKEAQKIKSALLLEDYAPLQLYESAMLVLGDDYDRGRQMIETVDDELLTAEQSELRGAIRSLTGAIRRWPDVPNVDDETKFETENGGPLAWPEVAAAKTSAKQSNELIASIDSLMQELDR